MSRSSLFLLPLCVWLWPAPAGADSSTDARVRCRASYERAQVLTRSEQLEAARTQLDICEKTCPDALVKDCATWRRELDLLMPTIRFDTRDRSGASLSAVTITENGHAIPTGDAIAVDPGLHVFRFEKEGFARLEVRVELHSGERGRGVTAVLTPETRSALPPAAVQPAPSSSSSSSSSKTAAYVVGGVSGAALIAAGVLAIKGLSDRSSLRSSCAPACDDSQLDPIRTEWWLAGGLGIAGAIGAGVAVFLFTRDDHASVAMPSITIAPRYASLRWTFE